MRALLAIVIIAIAAPTAAMAQSAPVRVLLVGNSLTAANDLPRLLGAVAAAAGDHYLTEGITAPNLALIDHLQAPSRAAAALAEHPWDVVILQQGPTTIGLCRDSLVLWTRLFDSLIVKAGARTALMMTWPPRERWTALEETRLSYAAAAAAVHGIFLPVGEALGLVRDAARPALLAADGFHPSALGSFLAALTIYERLSGRDLRRLDRGRLASSAPIPLTAAALAELLEAAHLANARYPDPLTGPPPDPAPRAPLPDGHC